MNRLSRKKYAERKTSECKTHQKKNLCPDADSGSKDAEHSDRIPEKIHHMLPEKIKSGIKELLSFPDDMPTALEKLAFKRIGFAATVLIFCIALSLWYKDIRYLSGMFISLAYAAMALKISHDFREGHLIEIPVICTASQHNALRKSTHVIFETLDEEPSHLIFDVPGRRNNDFIPECTYLIYVDERSIKHLIADIDV